MGVQVGCVWLAACLVPTWNGKSPRRFILQCCFARMHLRLESDCFSLLCASQLTGTARHIMAALANGVEDVPHTIEVIVEGFVLRTCRRAGIGFFV
jgi:hypothetical protein